MKRLFFPGRYDLSALYDELVAAGVPESWDDDGETQPLALHVEEPVEVDPETAEHRAIGPAGIVVQFSDKAEAKVRKVISKHDGEAAALIQEGAALRQARDRQLAASDWTQLPDSSLSDKQRAAWAEYRQALRDLPGKTKDAANPVWPEPPA